MPTKVKKKYQPKLKKLEGRFAANEYAESFMHGLPTKNLIVRVRPRSNPIDDDGWIFFYYGRERVWSCNPQFFKAHFVRTDK